MKKLSVLGAAVVLLAVTGCDNDPAAGQAKAQASAATEAAAAPAAASDVVQVDLKSQDGAVEFVGAKITDKHAGSFKEFSGVISLVDGDIEKSSVKVSIDVGSMEIEPAKLKGHLLGEDFFDAAKFPKAEFSSTVIVMSPGIYLITAVSASTQSNPGISAMKILSPNSGMKQNFSPVPTTAPLSVVHTTQSGIGATALRQTVS